MSDTAQQLAVKVENLEERQGRLEGRQDKLEEMHRLHREEFAETRTYTKESYRQLERIALSITSLEKSTNDRMEQQARHYDQEIKAIEKEIQALQRPPQPPQNPDKKDDSTKETFDFAWKVVAGVLALATTALGLLQIFGAATPK